MAYVLQSSVFIPLTLYIHDKQNKKKKRQSKVMVDIKALIFAKALSNYDGIQGDK